MDFSNAVNLMKLGVPVRRTSWDDQQLQIKLQDGIFRRFDPHANIWLKTVFWGEEVLATDWEAVRTKAQ